MVWPSEVPSLTSLFPKTFDLLKLFTFISVDIQTSGTFDSFMVQVRKEDDDDGNSTQVGSFVDVPPIAVIVKCQDNRLAAVTNKGIEIVTI